jgi:hypothetical protein
LRDCWRHKIRSQQLTLWLQCRTCSCWDSHEWIKNDEAIQGWMSNYHCGMMITTLKVLYAYPLSGLEVLNINLLEDNLCKYCWAVKWLPPVRRLQQKVKGTSTAY